MQIIGVVNILASLDRTSDLVSKSVSELVAITKVNLKKLCTKNSILVHLVKPFLVEGMGILNSIDIAYEYKVKTFNFLILFDF